MRRTALLTALALLAVPSAAQAAPATIAPHAEPVSASGTTTIEVANSGRRALSGRATVTVGRRVVARRDVRLRGRGVTEVRLRLRAGALEALRAAGTQRATVTARVRRAGGPVLTARRRVTLRLAAGSRPPAPAPAPAPGPAPVPAPVPSGGGGPVAPPQPSNLWNGRMGADGAYDDLAFTLDGGRMTLTKLPAVPVFCFESSGSAADTWTSGELFDAPGPWTLGADETVELVRNPVNPLVTGPLTVTYKVSGTTQTAGRVTGTLGMIFYDARPDVFTGAMEIVNCHGASSFEAVPAG